MFCEINDDIYVHRFNEEIEPYLHLEGGKLTVGPLDEILDGDLIVPVFVENDCAVQMARTFIKIIPKIFWMFLAN